MKVSVITSTFNSEATVRDTLKSVVSQSYGDIEHIIVDGASTDQTLAIVDEYKHIVKVISEPDNGIYDAMNKGILHSTGDVILFLNSDDFYANPYIIELMVYQKTISGVSSVYADLDYVSEDLKKVFRKWRSGNYKRERFKYGWMPPHPTFMAERQLFEQLGGFNTNLRSAADYELMLRFLFKNNVSSIYLPKVAVKMRVGGLSNSSFKHRIFANKEDQRAWAMNNLTMPFYLPILKPLRKVKQFLPF